MPAGVTLNAESAAVLSSLRHYLYPVFTEQRIKISFGGIGSQIFLSDCRHGLQVLLDVVLHRQKLDHRFLTKVRKNGASEVIELLGCFRAEILSEGDAALSRKQHLEIELRTRVLGSISVEIFRVRHVDDRFRSNP